MLALGPNTGDAIMCNNRYLIHKPLTLGIYDKIKCEMQTDYHVRGTGKCIIVTATGFKDS